MPGAVNEMEKVMSLLPVMVILGLSFPPVFFVLLVSLALFFLPRRLLQPAGVNDFVWHPTLFIPRCVAACFIWFQVFFFEVAVE